VEGITEAEFDGWNPALDLFSGYFAWTGSRVHDFVVYAVGCAGTGGAELVDRHPLLRSRSI
jgi:hypothetical protein